MRIIIRLFLAAFILFSLTACWGEDADDNDNKTNNKITNLNAIKISTFTGQYNITHYIEKYDNMTIDSDNTTYKNFNGEVVIRRISDNSSKLDYTVNYTDNNNIIRTPSYTFFLKPKSENQGKVIIDESKIDPTPSKIYDPSVLEKDLEIRLEGMTRDRAGKDKFDLTLKAVKISDNPDYDPDKK